MDFISRLPDETLYKILGYLEGNELAKCSNVSRRFNDAANDADHWKKLCGFDWLIFEVSNKESTWKDCYADMYRRYGRYVKCYSRVKRCWDKIYAVTRERCPPIYDSLLREGTSEETLNEVQPSHAKLPLEYRCSYRLCNGQRNIRLFCGRWFCGLFGSYDNFDFGDYMCSVYSSHFFRRCCLSFVDITRTVMSNSSTGSLAVCVRDSAASEARRSCKRDAEHKKLDGRIVSERVCSLRRVELFICSNSFIDFLEDFANRIGAFPAINNRFLKYDFNSAETTGPFTVTVRTAFYREWTDSDMYEKKFHFFYRITISMHPDAPLSDACQMTTRHWIMTNADGKVETSTEPADGNNPVMRPGAKFTRKFSAAFATPGRKMSGYFTMKRLNEETEIRINCPEFAMVAPSVVEILKIPR